MSFDGSGNYTPAAPPNFPAITGTTIVSDYYNNVINDIAAALSICITRDGQGKPTAAIDWNGQDLSGVGTLTAAHLNITSAIGVASGGTGVTTVPGNGKILIGNGAGYTLANITGTGGIGIANGAGSIQVSISGAITASNLTCSTGVLLGRSSAGTGAIQEIAIGAGLSLSGGTLTNTGGGGGGGGAALTMNNGGGGAASGTVFDGTLPKILSYNTIGAQPSMPRTSFSASGASYTPTGSIDIGGFTALAANTTLNAPTGMVDGFGFVVRIQDNGTARTINYNAAYVAVGVTLPTTTVSNKVLYLNCIWNGSTGKANVVGVQQQ